MDEDASQAVFENIKKYAEKARKDQANAMEIESQNIDATGARLTSTIEELQKRLEQRQAELDRVKSKITNPISTSPSTDPRQRLQQIRTITRAYELMIPESPDLPAPNLALQPLLAARTVQSTIKSSKSSIISSQSRLESATNQLASEEGQLVDSETIADAIEARTKRLQSQQRENLTKTDAEKAKELLSAKTKRKQGFEQDTKKLRGVLVEFIEEHLAAMLAAEEIGGPVVGELMDVDEDMLSAGFSATGKPKQSSEGMSEDKRQRRIDEIWGGRSAGAVGEDENETEKNAAAEEVRTLLDSLITSGDYVELVRDSAVARFLVRSRVAQLHPKDARRLRLIDFARDLI